MRTLEESDCKGKSRFRSPTQAEKVAKRMRRRSKEPLAPYLCRWCKWFHIGHQAMKGRK